MVTQGTTSTPNALGLTLCGGMVWRIHWVPFQGTERHDTGKTAFPTIFNVLVDVFLRHWVSVVAEAEGETAPEGFGRYIQHMEA